MVVDEGLNDCLKRGSLWWGKHTWWVPALAAPI